MDDDFFFADMVSSIPCCLCKGPVMEFSVPSDVWNAVVRRHGPETDKEYLCVVCFHKAVAAYVRTNELFGNSE